MIVSRRLVLRHAASGALGLLEIGCKRKVPEACVDTAGLSAEEIAARQTLAYRDATPFPDKTCESCAQYLPAKVDTACGSCKILKGSTHPYGYCKSYAPKT